MSPNNKSFCDMNIQDKEDNEKEQKQFTLQKQDFNEEGEATNLFIDKQMDQQEEDNGGIIPVTKESFEAMLKDI